MCAVNWTIEPRVLIILRSIYTSREKTCCFFLLERIFSNDFLLGSSLLLGIRNWTNSRSFDLGKVILKILVRIDSFRKYESKMWNGNFYRGGFVFREDRSCLCACIWEIKFIECISLQLATLFVFIKSITICCDIRGLFFAVLITSFGLLYKSRNLLYLPSACAQNFIIDFLENEETS